MKCLQNLQFGMSFVLPANFINEQNDDKFVLVSILDLREHVVRGGAGEHGMGLRWG